MRVLSYAVVLTCLFLSTSPAPSVSAQADVHTVAMEPLLVTARDAVEMPAVAVTGATTTAIVLTVCYAEKAEDADLVAHLAPRDAAQWCVYPVGRCSARGAGGGAGGGADMAVYLTPDAAATIYASTTREVCR